MHFTILSFTDLERCVSTSYTPSIAVHAVRNVQDMKIKMGQALSGGMKGRSKPHWFRFSKDAEGKLWVNDPWEPLHPLTEKLYIV